ncbi:MAG: hypothetical protein JRN39_06750 [Nitrososphaerota archaeon]|nr:hypothetical protein [Nitrososphaerota archaeon]
MKIAVWHGSREREGAKGRVADAIRKLELHRREMVTLRGRMQDRSSRMLEGVIASLQKKERERATLYASENVEIKKIIRVLKTAELALTQVILRLESIKDVGDAMSQMEQAFGVIRGMGKALSGLYSEMSNIQNSIQNTLTNTMSELGHVAPDLTIDVQTSSGEEIVQEAMRFVEAKFEGREAEEPRPRQELFERAAELLGAEEEERAALTVAAASGPALEEAVSSYITRAGRLDVYEAATAIGEPVDSVERAVIKLVSEGKLKLPEQGEQI